MQLRGLVPKRLTTIIPFAIIVATVWVASNLHVYFVREFSWGDILWNSDQAYIFLEVTHEGSSVNRLRYTWVLLKNYLGVIEPFSENIAYLQVIQVASSGTDSHVLRLDDRDHGGSGADPTRFTPMEGRIYASCPGEFRRSMQNVPLIGIDPLCWWAGDHFEKTTREEQQRLHGRDRLTTGDMNNANGWSRREVRAGADDLDLGLDVGGKFRLMINNRSVVNMSGGTLTIEVLRPESSPERLVTTSTRTVKVTRAEYERALRYPK
jgi:hypothetical protein